MSGMLKFMLVSGWRSIWVGGNMKGAGVGLVLLALGGAGLD